MIDRNFILNLCQESSDINEYLMSLYNIPKQMGAKVITEIGAGRSTFALVAAANETNGQVMSIDIGGWDTLNRVQNGVSLMENEKRFTLIIGNSLKEPKNLFPDIDFLFWDSEHTLDLSKKEIERWFPNVKKGGVIACHDTMHEDPDKQGAKIALDEYLKEHQNEYTRIDLLDTKLIGLSILVKL